MKGIAVPLEPLVRSNPSIFSGRIVDAKTHVQSEQKEPEIESDTCSPVCCKTFSECIPSEHCKTVGFSIVTLEGPYISYISKHSTSNLPENVEAVFDIGFQAHVTCLVRNDE